MEIFNTIKDFTVILKYQYINSGYTILIWSYIVNPREGLGFGLQPNPLQPPSFGYSDFCSLL